MKITTLIEDTSCREDVQAEHGLSLFIETPRHHLLMDTGASDLTWANAQTLGKDLSEIDTVVISHGHYDHAGGLCGFALQNPDAEIYLHPSAFGAYFHGERYIGMDPRIRSLPRLHLVSGTYAIDEELSLFSDVTGRRLWPQGNRALLEQAEGKLVQDRFAHEQSLVIRAEGRTLLVSGCAHNGILNILDRFHELYRSWPDAVVSGFHMMKKDAYTGEELAGIRATARELSGMPTVFYTGHCTGQEAFCLMKETMGEQLRRIRAGTVFSLP